MQSGPKLIKVFGNYRLVRKPWFDCSQGIIILEKRGADAMEEVCWNVVSTKDNPELEKLVHALANFWSEGPDVTDP